METKRVKRREPLTQWDARNEAIVNCERCPRLCAWCAAVALEKRRAFADQTYWGKPLPNWGEPTARLLIVGLAPAAHGGNRTGRFFTGDRSGDFLFEAMHATGFANQPQSLAKGDGLELIDCAITAAAHCAPPDNKPTPVELLACREHLAATINLLPRLRAIVCLGRIAQDETIRTLATLNVTPPDGRPPFGHGATVRMSNGIRLISSFHPSQQNTFTGRLTQPMLQAVFRMARGVIDRADK
jgi:uracil-DNA glycosylase family 4